MSCERLTGRPVLELTALDEPLAPDTAARRQGVAIPPVADYVDRIRALADQHDTVLVGGRGRAAGAARRPTGGTLLDLAAASGPSACATTAGSRWSSSARAGLGTLNHTELTVGALRAAGWSRPAW